ncbi:MAG: mandelate racemase/muconate lactonizing enzyme family protein [Halonotius sp.]
MWVEPFSLPLESSLETAKGPITERRGFLVGVEGKNDDQPAGIGEATPLAGWTESHEACQDALAATDPNAPDSPPDPATTPAAAHAVELAELDARGRRTGTPLAGGLRAELGVDTTIPATVPVNATVGDSSVDETVTAAETAIEEGYDCLKLKVGSRAVDEDIERVRAVREAIGDAVEIRVDANGAWSESAAETAITAFADLDVAYVEQPLANDALAAHNRLRGQGIDIALDESLAEVSIEAVIEREAADVVILKPMALGGPLRAIRAAATAREAGIEPVVTTTIDGVVARTAAVHVAAAIPDVAACGVATGSLLAGDLAADPVTISDGGASVPTGGGLCGNGFDNLP